MKEHDSRIAIRLSTRKRREIDRLIEEGKFKNLSQVIREALEEFLAK